MPCRKMLILKLAQEVTMSDKEQGVPDNLEKDQTTRPSLRKGDGPIKPSGTARQPRFDRKTGAGPASDDPTE